MDATGKTVTLQSGDALVVVDVQQDFVSGSLAVSGGREIIAPLNDCIMTFSRARLPVVATRDWHPPDHQSFRAHGGPWPIHCVADTQGAAFAKGLLLPANAALVSKGSERDREAYSGFEGTDLEARLRRRGVRRLFVGGLATDYCVLRTVLDARARGFDAFVLEDAIRAVDAHPGDGASACEQMRRAGAVFVRARDLVRRAVAHG